MKQNISALITIFGATGDLSYRKLFPSIYNLFQKGYFGKSIAIIGTGLDELTTEEFRQQVKLSIKIKLKNHEILMSFCIIYFINNKMLTSKKVTNSYYN